MIVSRSTFEQNNFWAIVKALTAEKYLAVDTETTGLRHFHGDGLFSIIIASQHDAYYFNFHEYDDVDPYLILPKEFINRLNLELFSDPEKVWFAHNAQFDMHMLANEGVEIAGTVHCTKAIGRVVENDLNSYSLDALLKQIGLAKIDTVEAYIEKHKLSKKIAVPGKKTKVTEKYYNKVPFDIIAPYGEGDGKGTLKLGKHQIQRIKELDQVEDKIKKSLNQVMENERRLTKTIYNMEKRGVLIDRAYCEKAIIFEDDRRRKAQLVFQRETGREFKDTSKLFTEVFADERHLWAYTDKNNPSFTSDVLKHFKNPGARAVLEVRDAKSKSDFYQGFLYHADANGVVHPNYNPDGTRHGRFSSSEPNLQNLTSEDEAPPDQEFIVRRAIIPRPGYFFISPDYNSMEYRFMLENACILEGKLTPLAKMVLDGFDVHDSTAKLASTEGRKIIRKDAKISNFLTLYGGGVPTLAAALGCTYDEALAVRQSIFKGAPEIKVYIDSITRTAEIKKYIINWFGRRCYFPFRSLAYRAPNYHISGGCADVVKVAMNQIDQELMSLKSKMVMTIHDELPIEVHESEAHIVPNKIKEIMEGAYPYRYLPLTTGMAWSNKSLGDLQEGFPK